MIFKKSKAEKSVLKKHELFRLRIQALGALICNGKWSNFIKGEIYRGPLKKACLPVLNCYSCPGALGSCPIGALQAVSNDSQFHISYYVIGLLMIFGLSLGRWFCGWLCPFGLLQELIYKLPVKKFNQSSKADKIFRYLKYVLLIVFVLFIPIFIFDQFGIGFPAFCKWICPAGILEGGIPLLLANPALKSAIGIVFHWKLLLAMIIIIGSAFIFRFFCKYLCPLGALYGLFNKISFYHLTCADTCIKCQKCAKICKMNVSPYQTPNSAECIRCGDCVKTCPVKALKFKV